MNRRIVVLASTVILAAVPLSAQFLAPGTTIPVVANLPGTGGTYWRSDVTVTNVSTQDTTVFLELFPEIRDGAPTFEQPDPVQLDLSAGQQLVLSNVVQTRFGLQNVKGALRVYSIDGTPLVISSRSWTPGNGGSYGQGVNGLLVANKAWVGDLVQSGLYRTNIGIFWQWDEPVTFTIRFFAADGTLIQENQVAFQEAGLRQLSLDSALGISSLPSGWAEITCSDDSLGFYAYSSRVDQGTGDAVYQAAVGRFEDVSP